MGARASTPALHRRQTPGEAPSQPSMTEGQPVRIPLPTGLRVGDRQRGSTQRIAIVVLGDVGRSPRMQYHAMSLAAHKVKVTVVGYTGERCIRDIENNHRVTFHRFDPPLSHGRLNRRLKRSAYIVYAIAKAVALMTRLLYELIVKVPRPDAMVVQNPPSLPGLACVWFACYVRRCTMIIDWHNLGFTMFGRGPRHPLVWATRKAEGFFGRRAGINIAVCHAMRDWIKRHFGVKEAYIVYDQPPDHFRPPTLSERHELFKRLMQTAPDFSDAASAHTKAISSPAVDLLSSSSSAAGIGGGGGGDILTRSSAVSSAAATSGNEDAVGVAASDGRNDAAAAGVVRRDDGSSSERFRGAAMDQERESSARGRSSGSGGYSNDANGAQRHGQKRKLGEEVSVSTLVEEKTPFTTRSPSGEYALRRDRPALLVSSTSWTPDEDFSVLLEAMARFDSRAASGAAPSLPFVVVVVTGKGPEKARYVEMMRAARLSRVALCTAWLEPEDYPLLLGSADLGISLHLSTSGVDLPMKVVDMFGCGVPVCAAYFECIHELVRDGHNGCVFKNSKELALQLEALLEGFPRAGCELEGYRSNVSDVRRWTEHWDEFAWPLFHCLAPQTLLDASRRARNAADATRDLAAENADVGSHRRRRWGGTRARNVEDQRDPSEDSPNLIAAAVLLVLAIVLWLPWGEKGSMWGF